MTNKIRTIDKLKTHVLMVGNNLKLLKAIKYQCAVLGIDEHEPGEYQYTDKMYVYFYLDGTYKVFDKDYNQEPLASLDSFFSLKPEPKKITVTFQLTEEQIKQVRQIIGETK